MTKYSEEEIRVADLTVDHKVQRAHLDMGKVEAMVRNYNTDGIGVATVSRRENGDQVVLDGWHRKEVVARLTDNAGTIPCRVFEGLTLQEEASLFLALNTTNQPKLYDRWKVRVTKGDPIAVGATEALRQYGWSVGNQVGEGTMVAVGSLERIYRLSLSDKVQVEQGLVGATIMVITRAWGHNRYGAVSPLFEGIANLIAEHGSRINLDSLITTMKEYKGGPQQLHQEARVLSNLRNTKLSMAVADQLTERYNKSKKTNLLPAWRRRR